jgi:hypothetical protein
MLRVKRTKTAPGTDKPAAHYAASVTPNGTVTRWDRHESQAVAITEAMAELVKQRHKGTNAGTLVFEPVQVSAEMLAKAVTADEARNAKEFAVLQAECRRLKKANDDLASKAQDAEAKAETATRRESELVGTLTSLEERLQVEQKRAAELAAKVAELEGQLKDDKGKKAAK